MYYLSDRNRRVWVRNLKVASMSLESALTIFCRTADKDVVIHYLDYEWVMVVRHPLERLRSYWTSEVPKKVHPDFKTCVAAILDGAFTDPHIRPQYDCIKGFKMPERIFKLETLNYSELSKLFLSPLLELPHRNASPAAQDDPLGQLSVSELKALRDYYADDSMMFGYV